MHCPSKLQTRSEGMPPLWLKKEQLFKKAAEGPMKGILSYTTETLVSSDYIGSPYSCIFDSNYTKVINGNFVKVYGWDDNEWGYSTRLVDLVEKLSTYI